MSVPYTFANQTSNIPLSELDTNFSYVSNYTTPLTGGVSETIVSKLSQTVSVMDFGATGDGVTDDTVAIQSALNSGAGIVYFPNGTYLISCTNNYVTGYGTYGLKVNANTSLVGESTSSIIKCDLVQHCVFFDIRGIPPDQLITGWSNGGNTGGTSYAFNLFALNSPDTGCVFTATSEFSSSIGAATTNIFTPIAGHKYQISFNLREDSSGSPVPVIYTASGTIASPTIVETFTPVFGDNVFTYTSTTENHIIFQQNTTAVAQYTVYDFFLFDVTEGSTRKANISFDNLQFQGIGNYAAFAIRTMWVDNLKITNNYAYGMGLLLSQDPDYPLTDNSSGIYNLITNQGGLSAVNQNTYVCNNIIFGYDSSKTLTPGSGIEYSIIGIDISFTYGAIISNNSISNIFWGIWGTGGNANPGSTGSDIGNTRYLVGALISGNKVVNGASGGIWWQMSNKFVVTGNYVSTVDDVGLEPEDAMNCLIENNYCEFGPSIMSQQRSAYNVVWKNNTCYQDGTERGYWLKQRTNVMFSDSSADESDNYYRQLILRNNTFIYQQGDAGASQYGYISPNELSLTNIDNNLCINSCIQQLVGITYGFSATNNTLYFTGAFNNPYHSADFTTAFSAIQIAGTLNYVSVGTDIPVLVSNNRIESAVSLASGTIGISIPLGNAGQSGTSTILQNNYISPSFPIGISFSSAGLGGPGSSPIVIKDNVVDLIQDITWQTYGSNGVGNSQVIYEGNKKNNGQDYFGSQPTVGVISMPFRFWYSSPSTYAGQVLIQSGAATLGTWSSSTSYTTGQQVTGSDGKVYIAIQNSTNENPTTQTAYWSLYGTTPAVFKQFGALV